MARKFTREQIIAKVEKLMAVAVADVEKAATAEERAQIEAQADNAAALAAQLMTEHQINESEISLGSSATRKPIESWTYTVHNRNSAGLMRKNAVGWIGQGFGAVAVTSSVRTTGGNIKAAHVTFYGTSDVLDTVKIVIPALVLSAESRVQSEAAEKRAEWRQNPHYSKRDVVRESDQFIKGWWHGYGTSVYHKLAGVRQRTAEEYTGEGSASLVLQSEADRIMDHINRTLGKTKKGARARTAYSAESLAMGAQAGREALVGQHEVSEENRPAIQ